LICCKVEAFEKINLPTSFQVGRFIFERDLPENTVFRGYKTRKNRWKCIKTKTTKLVDTWLFLCLVLFKDNHLHPSFELTS